MLIFKVYFFLLRTEMQKKKSKKNSLFTKYMYIIRYWYTELHNRKAKNTLGISLYENQWLGHQEVRKLFTYSSSCYKLIFVFQKGESCLLLGTPVWRSSLQVVLTTWDCGVLNQVTLYREWLWGGWRRARRPSCGVWPSSGTVHEERKA